MEKDCLFCKIANAETPTENLYQNEHLVVFKDIHPQAPVHLLIVPKKHIRSINDLTDSDRPIIAEMILAAQKMAKKLAAYFSSAPTSYWRLQLVMCPGSIC
jgi:histidine triad (HIT) family protein